MVLVGVGAGAVAGLVVVDVDVVVGVDVEVDGGPGPPCWPLVEGRGAWPLLQLDPANLRTLARNCFLAPSGASIHLALGSLNEVARALERSSLTFCQTESFVNPTLLTKD